MGDSSRDGVVGKNFVDRTSVGQEPAPSVSREDPTGEKFPHTKGNCQRNTEQAQKQRHLCQLHFRPGTSGQDFPLQKSNTKAIKPPINRRGNEIVSNKKYKW